MNETFFNLILSPVNVHIKENQSLLGYLQSDNKVHEEKTCIRTPTWYYECSNTYDIDHEMRLTKVKIDSRVYLLLQVHQMLLDLH